MRVLASVAALLLAGSTIAFGQETTRTINGRIRDAQGLAVPGVTVTAIGLQGMKEAVTDAEGTFSIPFLTPGRYEVRAELQRFKTLEQSGVAVALGQVVELPLRLEIGGVTETIQVTGAPDIVNTGTTTIGANLGSDLLRAVPVGRNVAQTTYLAPGVSSSGTAGESNPSIAGGTGLDNQYVIDGVNVTIRATARSDRIRSWSARSATPRRSTSFRKSR